MHDEQKPSTKQGQRCSETGGKMPWQHLIKEQDSEGGAGRQQGLLEEAMLLGLRTEASVGVEQLQANALHGEEAKSISRARTSRWSWKAKIIIGFWCSHRAGKNIRDHRVISPLVSQAYRQTRASVLLTLYKVLSSFRRCPAPGGKDPSSE